MQGTDKPVLLRLPWKWKQLAFTQHFLTFTNLYCVKTQKTVIHEISKMLGWNSWVSLSRQKKEKINISIRLQTLAFRGTVTTFTPHQSFRFLSLGILKNPIEFSSNWKWIDTSRTHVWCLSNHSQPPRDILKIVTVHYQTCPCMNLLMWETFWASVVNCDLINNNKSTLVKFATCNVNVLCQL